MIRLSFCAFLFCAFILSTNFGFSQNNTTNPLIPDQIPPPADAASLGKYGDIPLNMCSGVPNISVPIFEIKTPKLSLPITLNYDASGIKVDEIASWVGLQWSLDAGGVITRTINGKDDLSGYLQLPLPPVASGYMENNEATWEYLDNLTQGFGDSQPDDFFYNFAGHSGQFVFGEDKTPIDIHHKEPLSIRYSLINGVKTFNILDGTGNQYIFGALEQTDYRNSSGGEASYISSWYLTKIISCDKTDSITFNYYADRTLLETSNNYSTTFQQNAPYHLVSAGGSTTTTHSTPLRLQNIVFQNGSINFYSSGPRLDVVTNKLDSIVVNKYNFSTKTLQPLKSIKFLYGYYTSVFANPDTTAYRLRLDSVRIKSPSGENGDKYSFVYNTAQLPAVHSLGRDLFNYYNGKDNNTTLVPDNAYTSDQKYNTGIVGADRNTYDQYMEAGILKRIYYPTSGYSEFTYEPNQYMTDNVGTKAVNQTILSGMVGVKTLKFTTPISVLADVYTMVAPFLGHYPTTVRLISLPDSTVLANSASSHTQTITNHYQVYLNAGVRYEIIINEHEAAQNGAYTSIAVDYSLPDTTVQSIAGGGLRVAAIKNYNQSGSYSSGNIYKYGTGENGFGVFPAGSTMLNTFSQNIIQSVGVNSSDAFGSCYITTTPYIVYSGNSAYDVFNLNSQVIYYPEVAQYAVDSVGHYLGKSVFDYAVYNISASIPTTGQGRSFYLVNNGNPGGYLLGQTDYGFSNGQFLPVKKIFNSYTYLPGPSGRSFWAQRKTSVSGCWFGGYGGTVTHNFGDFPINSGTVLPIVQTTINYNFGDTTKFVRTSRYLTYNNSMHMQPVTIVDTVSDGTTIITNNRYPEDKSDIINLSTTQSSALDQMVLMHNITPVIQTTVKRDTSSVSLIKQDYKIWDTNMVYPDTIELKTGSYPIENRAVFKKYDNSGNILEDALLSGPTTSYIWDYNNSCPVAEIKNAEQNNVAYTSFEADGSGNWAITSTQRNSVGFTGNRSYSLNNGSISKTGLTSTTTYVISYWSNSLTPITIGGTSAPDYPLSGPTINGWTYHEHRVTGITSITLSGSGNIDEVRLYPQNAQMITYTYAPLVGMTSSTDAKNQTTYYEYDDFQRLINIKDQNGDILKHSDYHYQNQ